MTRSANARRSQPRHSLRRSVIFAVACLALAGVVGTVAIVDHRNKQARIDRAEIGEWYCRHEGTHCGGPSSHLIELHWNERQLGYEVAVGVLGAVALGYLGRAVVAGVRVR